MSVHIAPHLPLGIRIQVPIGCLLVLWPCRTGADNIANVKRTLESYAKPSPVHGSATMKTVHVVSILLKPNNAETTST